MPLTVHAGGTMTAPPGQQQQQLVESKGQLVVSLPQVLQGETEDTIADVAVAVLGLSEEECAALRQYPQGLQKRTLMKLRAGAWCLFALLVVVAHLQRHCCGAALLPMLSQSHLPVRHHLPVRAVHPMLLAFHKTRLALLSRYPVRSQGS
jgi:hypothetical protein